MTEPEFERQGRYLGQLDGAEGAADLFEDFYQPIDETMAVGGLRRRRRRVANNAANPVKAVSLVEEDGVLYWRDGVPARKPVGRRGRRRGFETLAPRGSLVLTREFPTLAPNKVVDALGALDRRLNPAIDVPLRSRLRELHALPNGTFELSASNARGPFDGRTLLFVHGTFSSAASMLAELSSGPANELLQRATRGAKKYRVLFFDHPTLAVSPVMNALELGRAMAGTTGQLDVVAHSRGGLVVRWWLEAFGASLAVGGASPVRAVLAGSPLSGTSLAAPDKIQNAMSLIANIGTFAEVTLKLLGPANPFLWVAGKLIEIIVSVTGALAKTPIVDALTALVPGLAAQSAVINNHEINRLRSGPPAIHPAYFAILSNFETADPRWRFWRNFRKDRATDLVADVVFPGENDLVVDTWSMTDFGLPKLGLAGKACDFGTTDHVWHCNYFRQQRAIDYIASAFRL